MTAQLTYQQTPAIGFKGMLAEQFSQRQVDSYVAEGSIISGDAVERGTYQTENVAQAMTLMDVANLIGVALFSHHQENPTLGGMTKSVVQESKVTFPSDFVSGDVVKIKVNNQTLSDVPFDTDNDTTLANVATELANADAIDTATDIAPDMIKTVGQNAGESYTIQISVFNGGSRTQSATVENTQEAGDTLVYQDKAELPVMARGRVFCKAGAAVSVGAEVVPTTGDDTTWSAGAGTSTTKGYARTAAGSEGDLFIVELVGP